ncbi:MAG: hypothetical protein RIE32_01135 [Phycisphaerales bacterium]
MFLSASPARAQFGMGMGNDAMQMAIGRTAVDRYSELLGFDEVQQETAEMLHRDYLDKFKQANDTLMDAMRRLQEEAGKTGDWQKMMKPMGKIMLGFFERVEALEETFFEDLRMIAIEPGQQEAFVRVERARRREKVETAGQMSVVNGGTIDLREIAREVEVLGNEPAREALLAYEAEIDPVYKRLIDRSYGFMREQMERMKNMADDDESMGFDQDAMTKMQEAMTEMRELGAQGKAINARYARQIMQVLPADRQGAWDREVKRRTWPTVYRQSKAERQIEAAGKLDDLTAEQRESLEAIRQSYEREASPINDRWAKAIDEQQSGDQMNWWGWGQDSTEVDEAEQARQDLDERFVERVRGLLTPQQIENMPEVGESGFDADEVLREFGGG